METFCSAGLKDTIDKGLVGMCADGASNMQGTYFSIFQLLLKKKSISNHRRLEKQIFYLPICTDANENALHVVTSKICTSITRKAYKV
jgi:hypothetical protein